MAKKVDSYVKLQIKGGEANPAPPVGPALGAKGLNIMDFCKQFNAKTEDQKGKLLPVEITVYADKSFDFIIKTPPASAQLMEAAKVGQGSPEPHMNKVGEVSWDQVKAIAEDKLQDLNTEDVEAAMRTVAGTAKSMGITIRGLPPWREGEQPKKQENQQQDEKKEQKQQKQETGQPAKEVDQNAQDNNKKQAQQQEKQDQQNQQKQEKQKEDDS